MNRLTFGVSALSFAANMAMKQNVLNHQKEYPKVIKAVVESFYVDDGLTGADSVEEAIELQEQLQKLFALRGLTLWKWKSSELAVTEHVPNQLLDEQPAQTISCTNALSQVLGLEWDWMSDSFRLLLSTFVPV